MFQLFMKQAGLEAEKMVFSNGIEFSINSDKFNKEKKKKEIVWLELGKVTLLAVLKVSQWPTPVSPILSGLSHKLTKTNGEMNTSASTA